MPKKEIIIVDELPIETVEHQIYSISQNDPNSYTHGMFKYPCKFIPEIPRWGLKKYAKDGDIIFDPFLGSGTTALEAIINGHDAIGTEVDLIAKKITIAKTQKYTNKSIVCIEKEFLNIFNQINDENNEVFVPNINNLEHWFTQECINILGSLKTLISRINDEIARNFFEVVFLSIIKPVSNADDISPKPYVSNRIKKNPPNAWDKFQQVYYRDLEMIKKLADLNVRNSVKIADGDALETITECKANIAITSPPYINAFDYARTLRLENLWTGRLSEQDILKLKSNYVGTERFNLKNEKNKEHDIFSYSKTLEDGFNKIIQVDEKRAYVVKKFFDDMKTNLINVREHLHSRGIYIIVIGDSKIRKVTIESWKIIKDIAEKVGYSYIEHFSYQIKNSYIRIPRGGQGGKVNYDHVLVLKKNDKEGDKIGQKG